jgi:hypothetical protein
MREKVSNKMKCKVVMQSQKVKHYFWMFYLMMLSFAMIIVVGINGIILFYKVTRWILLFMENKLFLQFN